MGFLRFLLFEDSSEALDVIQLGRDLFLSLITPSAGLLFCEALTNDPALSDGSGSEIKQGR